MANQAKISSVKTTCVSCFFFTILPHLPFLSLLGFHICELEKEKKMSNKKKAKKI
jgi:hypothetical protein